MGTRCINGMIFFVVIMLNLLCISAMGQYNVYCTGDKNCCVAGKEPSGNYNYPMLTNPADLDTALGWMNSNGYGSYGGCLSTAPGIAVYNVYCTGDKKSCVAGKEPSGNYNYPMFANPTDLDTAVGWMNSNGYASYRPGSEGSSDLSGRTGTCGNSCSAEERCCNGACTETNSDSQNCGSCGNICPQGYNCISGSCSNIENPSVSSYAVFLLTNVGNGAIWVGSESDLKTAKACSFFHGGSCKNDGSDLSVQYVKKSQDFSSYDEAKAAYCAEPRSNERSFSNFATLTGGTTADIYGGNYWIDLAPECPS